MGIEMSDNDLRELVEGVAKKNGQFLSDLVKKETDPLTRAVEAQGLALQKLGGTSHYGGPSIASVLETQKANIQGLASGDRRSLKFSVNKTLVTRAGVSGSTLAMRLPDVGQIAAPSPILRPLFNHVQVGPNSGGMIRYFDQAAVTRGAAMVAEAQQKPESAISWIERSLPIQKIADSIPVTKEALNDFGFVEGEIRRLLTVNLSLKEDEQLYSGDGVPPNLKGVYTSAPVFVSTPYADSVDNANLFDLILVVAADIAANRGAKYTPDTVLINPGDALRMKLMKNPTTGAYLLPPSVSFLRIVESAQVTPNTMVVGDFSYGTIYDLEEVTIEMGWINDQFIKNCITILAEQRLALLIRTVDETAFRKVTSISAALGDLETP